MIERPELPADYVNICEQIITPLGIVEPSYSEQLADLRNVARGLSDMSIARFDELGARPNSYSFHSLETADGALRVAIAPPDAVYRGIGNPVWRVIINQGSTIFQNAIPREQWDYVDILVQPGDYRIGVNRNRGVYELGYRDIDPQQGMPPRIIQEAGTTDYALRHATGYVHSMPEIPLFGKASRINFYRTYAINAANMLGTLNLLSETTRVGTSSRLERDEGL